MSIYSTRKSKNQKKNGPSGAPGPASARPWRAKRGTLPKLSTFLSQLKGDPLEKKPFEKKSLNAKKLKGGPLGFSSFILSQNIKKLKGGGGNFYFRKKISQCRKKLKGGTLWDFPTSILSQNSKKMKGGPFEEKKFRKKSRSAENIERGDSLDLARYGMLRGKTGKTTLVQFARPNGAI